MKTGFFLAILVAFSPAVVAQPAAALHGEAVVRYQARVHVLHEALRVRLASLHH